MFDPRLKNTTWSFSAMLTVFLTGLALGSALAGTFVSRLKRPRAAYGLVLCLGVNDPRSVLTVGFGSGGASWSFLRHGRLQQVDCVGICPAVVEAAPWMKAANHGLLDRPDPRYRIIFDDARAYLRYTQRRYDVISTDCTDLRYKSSANLYDWRFEAEHHG